MLWDSIECIVPSKDYSFKYNYKNKLTNEAFELIAKKYVPNNIERKKADKDIREVVQKIGDDLLLQDPLSRLYTNNYLIYPNKFLQMTWRRLEQRGLANWNIQSLDYGVSPSMGLLMMSALANACVGTQKQKVTDRTFAYSLLEKFNAVNIGAPYVEGLDASQIAPELNRLVSISINALGAKNISLKKLISFRKRELKGKSTDYRTMRLNYMKALNSYISRIVKECKSKKDLLEIERQFKEEIKTDLYNLKHELNLKSINSLISKEMIASIMLIGGTFLEPVSGITSLAASLKGIGVIPLIKTVIKLKENQRKELLKNKISWLYLTKD